MQLCHSIRMRGNKIRNQAISLEQVTKAWGDTLAVDRIDLHVAPGTFTVLLGPSGCGKSTSLRIIAGLEHADEGNILIGDQPVNHLPPSRRDIAMVFQSYALFPHLSVAENILFGLKVRRTPKAEQRTRLHQTADLLGLSEYLARKPSQLSGGQQQRVALGRAIIAEKPICLMDEPLSNLDAKLRNTMRTEIRDLQQSLGFSMVYVTHDQAEAITMADQVVLMKDGRVEQSGTPKEIYETPATAFVAGFIGTPPMNLLPALALLDANSQPAATDGVARDSLNNITVGIRPEHVCLSDGIGIEATVEHVEYLGADMLADCRLNSDKGNGHKENPTLLARVAGNSTLQPNTRIKLNWSPQQMHYFNAETGEKIQGSVEPIAELFSSPTH